MDLEQEGLAKKRRVYDAFMDLAKGYDRDDWGEMCEVMKVYRVDSKLLHGVKGFIDMVLHVLQ